MRKNTISHIYAIYLPDNQSYTCLHDNGGLMMQCNIVTGNQFAMSQVFENIQKSHKN